MIEALWNFSRFKDENRLTLGDNPHFYEKFPSSPETYGPDFRADPIEWVEYLMPLKHVGHEKISVSVLINRKPPGRVFLETDMTRRAFVNFWCPKDAIIFKGLRFLFYLFSLLT